MDAKDDCPHYLALELEDVKVGPSPEWAQKQLRAIGLQPINNVVDATNLVLHEFGNPLHAFDMEQIGGSQIRVRKAKQGEAFTTLDGQARTLDAQDLVIADRDKPMCLAGVYGGADRVSDRTTKVVLEAAWFHPVTVRKSAKATRSARTPASALSVVWTPTWSATQRHVACTCSKSGRVPD